MLLQKLYEFYGRLENDPDSDVAPTGFSRQKVSFSVVISLDGKLIQIDSLLEQVELPQKGGKSKTVYRTRVLTVPGSAKSPGSGINPCLFWDNPAYLLGYKESDDKPERTRSSFEAFRDRHLEIQSSVGDAEFDAVCTFLRSWDPTTLKGREDLANITTGFGVFQVVGIPHFVHDSKAVKKWWQSQLEASEVNVEKDLSGECLITGIETTLARLHEPKIKGVRDAQAAGASIVSFNSNAYESYGKSQSYNAPVSQDAAFRYCTALNWLLDRQNKRSVLIGDTTVVFWTEVSSPAESFLASLFDSSSLTTTASEDGEDKGLASSLETVLKAISQGRFPPVFGEAETPFYILGLAPNASRLSVRFWHESTLGELVENLHRHYSDLAINGRQHWQPEYPSPRDLLPETVRDAKDIPPLLGGALMRAILLGSPYPEMLLVVVLRRTRMEQDVNYLKAAIIKACLNRNHQKEVSVSLDPANSDAAYHMGRLFAVFDKCHTDAIPGVNASIKDRYFGAASATPGSVFPRLIRMNQHHIGKMEIGQATYYEKLLQSICDKIQKFPSHLALEQQGLFALGYYHQRQDLYTKKIKPEPEAVSA